MNSMQIIMCAYVYVTFLSNTLLTIPDEILWRDLVLKP